MQSLTYPTDPIRTPRISASTIGTFRRCERLFAFNYLFEVGNEGSEATRRGTAVHNALEAYYQGMPLDPWSSPIHAIAIEALPHIPPLAAKPWISTEREFVLPFAGVEWQGRKDLEFFPPDPDRWELFDYKTTGDFKWAKSELVLETSDLQSALYALEIMIGPDTDRLRPSDDPIDSIRYKWIYLQTQQRRTTVRPVSGRIYRCNAEDTVAEAAPHAKRALAMAQTITDPFEANPNPRACRDFGGCQFQIVCGTSQINPFTDHEKDPTMTQPVQLTPEEFRARFAPKAAAPSLPPGSLRGPPPSTARQGGSSPRQVPTSMRARHPPPSLLPRSSPRPAPPPCPQVHPFQGPRAGW